MSTITSTSLNSASTVAHGARADASRPETPTRPAFTRGASIDDTDGVRRTGRLPYKHMAYVRELVQSGDLINLHRALAKKEEYGVDVNAPAPGSQQRLLHDAFEHINSHDAQSGVVKELLRHGANPNLRNAWGLTPLDVATQRTKPNPVAIQQLLNAGAKVSDLAMNRASQLMNGPERWLYNMLCDAPRQRK